MNNFSKSTMVDFRCLGNEICTIFAKNWLELRQLRDELRL